MHLRVVAVEASDERDSEEQRGRQHAQRCRPDHELVLIRLLLGPRRG